MTYSDLEKNFKQIELMSAQGDANAQNQLGVCHLVGIAGLPKDPVKANELFALSAAQGFPKAQFNLGVSYMEGRGVQKDEEKGTEWMKKAAGQGLCSALRFLGVCHYYGTGVEKDWKKAVELLTSAAKRNDSASQYELGRWYENGWAVRKDAVKACGWYEKAAKQGYKDAAAAIERLVKNGEINYFSFSTRQKIKGKWYTRVIPFGDNFIVQSKGLWGIVDGQNNVKLPVRYMRVHWFAGGYAGLQEDNRWGLVDTDGNVTIKPQYDSIWYLRQNKACEAEKDGRKLVVSPDGSIPFKARGKNCRFEGDKIFVWTKGSLCRLYDTDGTPFGGSHELIHVEEDYFVGYDKDEKSRRNRQTLIKSNGEEVKLPICEISVFRNHIAKFRHNNKYGIIDDNGNVVVPNQYDFISLEYDGIIAINVGNQSKDYDAYFYAEPFDGKWQLWNDRYQAITPYYYDDLSSIDVGGACITIAQRDGHWYLITPNGETLFAEDDNELEEKRKASDERDTPKDPEEGQFEIFGDTTYKKEGYKFYVRAYDGKYIRHYYYTPYLAMPVTGLDLHWKIGDSFVNIYGQDMPNLHPFKISLPKKPRRIFRLVPEYSRLSNKDKITLFVDLMTFFGLTKREVISIYSCFKTDTRRAVACDWIVRKLRRNKSFKMDVHELASMSVDIEYWLRRKGIEDK